MKLCLKYVNILRRNGEERVANNQNVCRYSFRYYGALFPRLTNIYLKKDSWKQIRRFFPEKPSIVYMNTGSVANSGGEVIAIISNGNRTNQTSEVPCFFFKQSQSGRKLLSIFSKKIWTNICKNLFTL